MSPIGRRLWALLSDDARERLRTPETVVDATYPLSTAQLAQLIGVSDRQISHWNTRGILPGFRHGRMQRYSIGAAVLATWLATMDMQERKSLARIAQEPSRFEPVQLMTYAMFDMCHDVSLEKEFVDAVGRLQSQLG